MENYNNSVVALETAIFNEVNALEKKTEDATNRRIKSQRIADKKLEELSTHKDDEMLAIQNTVENYGERVTGAVIMYRTRGLSITRCAEIYHLDWHTLKQYTLHVFAPNRLIMVHVYTFYPLHNTNLDLLYK